MTDFKLASLTGKRLTSLLGLSLDGSRLEGVWLRRTNGSAQIQGSFSAALSLDPLTAAPELVGREIRNHLDAAEIRERHCTVALPLKWLLTTHAEIPELPEAEKAELLSIEAERGFPCEVSLLEVATSRSVIGPGKEHALLTGIPRTHLDRLELVLHAAKLKPVSFSLGITALQPSGDADSEGVLALALGEGQAGMQVSSGGGIVALRVLEGVVENQGGRLQPQAESLAREARITLGQLPQPMRDPLKRMKIYGPPEVAQKLADELDLRLEALGLKTTVVRAYAADEFGVKLPQGTPVSAALSLAARHLAGQRPVFEYLPKRVPSWQRVWKRYTSGKLGSAGVVGAAILVLAVGLFTYQELQLVRLGSQWRALAPKVRELETLREQIRQYRSWFDDSARGLSILRQLTLAFPEDGAVSAKTVEIRDLNTVSCSGVARDNTSLLRMLDKLRTSGGVSELKVNQIRGKAPQLQFTFDFRWSDRNEN
jgi:hypothetical protein